MRQRTSSVATSSRSSSDRLVGGNVPGGAQAESGHQWPRDRRHAGLRGPAVLQSGRYNHVTGGFTGLHLVCVTGYDDRLVVDGEELWGPIGARTGSSTWATASRAGHRVAVLRPRDRNGELTVVDVELTGARQSAEITLDESSWSP